jgi:hypothetical protein
LQKINLIEEKTIAITNQKIDGEKEKIRTVIHEATTIIL